MLLVWARKKLLERTIKSKRFTKTRQKENANATIIDQNHTYLFFQSHEFFKQTQTVNQQCSLDVLTRLREVVYRKHLWSDNWLKKTNYKVTRLSTLFTRFGTLKLLAFLHIENRNKRLPIFFPGNQNHVCVQNSEEHSSRGQGTNMF